MPVCDYFREPHRPAVLSVTFETELLELHGFSLLRNYSTDHTSASIFSQRPPLIPRRITGFHQFVKFLSYFLVLLYHNLQKKESTN